jgi:crotonobetainyl-CoA:carnitine CoA-transferase CaiB-like acyl-CoA transferase
VADQPPAGRLPLEDVRILASEQYGAGPWATLQLCELGAEVIKIEDPGTGGDIGRYVPPFQDGEESLFFDTFNWGKKSIQLDLKNAAGREVFGRLVERSDAVFSNLRGDQPAKLGLRYADLSSRNPRIVCCSLSGYGQDGPRAAAGALDYVIQGLAGWMATTGEPGAPPTRTGPSLVDYSGGYVAAIALLGGLWRARRDGIGCDCDVSLQETALSLLTYVATWAATHDHVTPRRPNSAHPSIVPFQNFATSDGWIIVACPKQEQWERLCRVIGREELLLEPAYANLANRDRNRDGLLRTIGDTFRERSAADWIALLEDAGVPVGPVNDVPAALRDRQVVARGTIESYHHETLGEVRRIGSPLRLSGPRREPARGPRRGEHTRAILEELGGLDRAEVEQLEAAGAFGPVEAARAGGAPSRVAGATGGASAEVPQP